MTKSNAGDQPRRLPAKTLTAVFKRLGKLYPDHPLDVNPKDPFRILVATILSSRTKDPVTNQAMAQLWEQASTPRTILKIPEARLAGLLHPVGFYKTKARQIHKMCRQLLDSHGGKVPATRAELLSLPGVGRKVANLVLNICYDIPAICVDTHVHRITNRLGWIETGTPEKTELALMEILPEKYWTPINRILVNHGQQVCHPTSPKCSECTITKYCDRIGVTQSR